MGERHLYYWKPPRRWGDLLLWHNLFRLTSLTPKWRGDIHWNFLTSPTLNVVLEEFLCTVALPGRMWKKSQELTGVASLYRPGALIAAPASPMFSGPRGPFPSSGSLGQQHICLASLPLTLQKQNSRPDLGGKHTKWENINKGFKDELCISLFLNMYPLSMNFYFNVSTTHPSPILYQKELLQWMLLASCLFRSYQMWGSCWD